MRSKVIARRYAIALFGAVELRHRNQLLIELKGVVDALHSNISLERYLYNRFIPTSKKSKLLTELMGESELNPQVYNLILLLAAKNSLGLLPDILLYFENLLLTAHNEVRIDLEVAVEPDVNTRKNIEAVLERQFGKKVLLKIVKNSSIIGGAKLYVGSLLYDFSLQTVLKNLRRLCLDVRL